MIAHTQGNIRINFVDPPNPKKSTSAQGNPDFDVVGGISWSIDCGNDIIPDPYLTGFNFYVINSGDEYITEQKEWCNFTLYFIYEGGEQVVDRLNVEYHPQKIIKSDMFIIASVSCILSFIMLYPLAFRRSVLNSL